eukprot:8567179-Karenia_brevis.AAC.1
MGGTWQRRAPLFHAAQQLEPLPQHGQLQRSHLSLEDSRQWQRVRHGSLRRTAEILASQRCRKWTTAACCAIVHG